MADLTTEQKDRITKNIEEVKTKSWFGNDDGEVLWAEHQSYLLLVPMLVFCWLIAIVGMASTVGLLIYTYLPIELVASPLALVPLGIGLYYYKKLQHRKRWYVITDQRVIKKTRIIGSDKTSKRHDDIVRVNKRIAPFEEYISRLTSEDIGTLQLYTADDSSDSFVMCRLPTVKLAESLISGNSENNPATPAYLNHADELGTNMEQTTNSTEQTRAKNTNPQETSEQSVSAETDPQSIETPNEVAWGVSDETEMNDEPGSPEYTKNTETKEIGNEKSDTPEDETEQVGMDEFEQFTPSDRI